MRAYKRDGVYVTENLKTATILASKAFVTLKRKTANGLVIYAGKYRIVAVIDEEKTGKDARSLRNRQEENTGAPLSPALEKHVIPDENDIAKAVQEIV